MLVSDSSKKYTLFYSNCFNFQICKFKIYLKKKNLAHLILIWDFWSTVLNEENLVLHHITIKQLFTDLN